MYTVELCTAVLQYYNLMIITEKIIGEKHDQKREGKGGTSRVQAEQISTVNLALTSSKNRTVKYGLNKAVYSVTW